jgi:hypothetical protein
VVASDIYGTKFQPLEYKINDANYTKKKIICEAKSHSDGHAILHLPRNL